eukprot:gene1944-1452_t
MASLFKDFYKPVKQVLDKEYAEDSFSFGAKGKSSKDAKFEFSSARNEDSVEASLKYDVKIPADFAAVNGSVKIHSDGNVEDEVTIEDKEVGVKAVLKGTLESSDAGELKDAKAEAKIIRNSAGVDVTYSHEHFKGTVGVTYRKRTPLKVNASAAGFYEGLSVGGDVTVHPQDKDNKVDSYNVGMAYKLDNSVFALLVEKKLSAAKLGLQHKFNSDVTGASEFKYDFKKKTHDFTVGANVKINEETKVKAKVKKDTSATVALFSKLNKNVEANFTVATKLSDLKDGKGSSKLSVGFDYEQ